MKPTLAETEQVFWNAITYPTGVDEYLKQASPSETAVFNAAFSETAEFSRVSRVSVYAEGYFFRLLDVIAEQFPTLVWQLGNEQFHNLVTDYLLVRPSQSPNLRRLGDSLPGFLEKHPLGERNPAAVAFSRIELAIDQAIDAADSSVLTRDALAKISPTKWPDMRLSFPDSLSVHKSSSDYRVFSDARRAGKPVPDAPIAGETFTTCVWRKGFTVFTKTLSSGESTLLRSLLTGHSFGEASSAAAESGLGANELVQVLFRWLSDEMIASVSVP